MHSARVALDKAFLLSGEAFNENWSDASARNFAALLPMGQYYDDPWEPGPGKVFAEKLDLDCGILGEIGTLSP